MTLIFIENTDHRTQDGASFVMNDPETKTSYRVDISRSAMEQISPGEMATFESHFSYWMNIADQKEKLGQVDDGNVIRITEQDLHLRS